VTISGKVARDCIFEDCMILNKTSDNGALHVFGANANDIERFMIFKNCIFASAVLGTGTQALAFSFTSNQTDGRVILQGCVVDNSTNTAGVNQGVFTDAPSRSATGTESIEVTV